jgi:hypothetical protein
VTSPTLKLHRGAESEFVRYADRLWLRGVPSVATVEAHHRAHAIVNPQFERLFHGPEFATFGSAWLSCNRYARSFGPVPDISRLLVIDRRVMLANGFTMWQPLDECEWAHQTMYLPLSAHGIPVGWPFLPGGGYPTDPQPARIGQGGET